ncbi:hypothetical protein COLO4_03386 [Corchorus olitorius]|uniref:Uncharacterized protein n=1 Tax=Corchorus olitorius TaxID=93759 RepID=A0A1R3KYY3_9ROSI|nr:hypothetical protein COLO4_03386 [Corchorus olitorius]
MKENTNPRPISTKIHGKIPPTKSNHKLPVKLTGTVSGGLNNGGMNGLKTELLEVKCLQSFFNIRYGND